MTPASGCDTHRSLVMKRFIRADRRSPAQSQKLLAVIFTTSVSVARSYRASRQLAYLRTPRGTTRMGD